LQVTQTDTKPDRPNAAVLIIKRIFSLRLGKQATQNDRIRKIYLIAFHSEITARSLSENRWLVCHPK